ncbi:TBC1 domain family member 31 isoform X1 [Parasteatoda tepidariorum]|uniref:TBC1 domain family member 31 isoform X1 n=1 Tax=Parasteatoda tepidariorum TaxID=114398 RepID=UPI0039BD5BC3
MESYVLDVGGRKKGILLQNKSFVPLSGPIFSICNIFHGKAINFVHAAWNKLDSQIVAGDSLGNIYLLYLQKNRFSWLCNLKHCSSYLTFTSDKSQDILVALSDCTIVSINSDLKLVKSEFNHHTSCVIHISFNKTGQTVLSCSKDQTILWDLDTFQIQRVLHLKRNVDIIKVFFLSKKDVIVSAFNDNSVFLWNFETFGCINQFVCASEDSYLNIKTIDASGDEKLLACAGRSNWFLVWDIEEGKQLSTILLPDNVSSVKQTCFLPSSIHSADIYILAILSSEGEVLLYDVKNVELLHKIVSANGKIMSLSTAYNFLQILTVSLQGSLDLYDVEDYILIKNQVKDIPKVKSSPVHKAVRSVQMKEVKTKKVIDVDEKGLRTILKNFGEYPEKHRFFIWSQLLKLPRNEEAFKILHQDSFQVKSFVKDYSFMNPGVQKTFLRLMSMLACWLPVIQEMDYIQCLVFPFIKVLHKNAVLCFEILITLISNWCQNWFLFCPFPPFNILSAVENIISFHDPQLLIHFWKNDISSEVYAWSLLKTSFSEVFNKNEWFKLWDNLFTNPPCFYLYAVAAFSITIRSALFQCKRLEEFKNCYRKHGISAAMLLKKAYELQNKSPKTVNPEAVCGTFSPIPKDLYPSFFQMCRMKIDLETLEKKKIIDQEIDFLKQREDALEIKSNYLKELQKLQMMRRDLMLDSMEFQDADALETLNKKLLKIQSLIQENLTNQMGMLKEAIGEEILFEDAKDSKKQYFEFQDYIKKLRRKNS